MITTILLITSLCALLMFLFKMRKIKDNNDTHRQLYLLFIVLTIQISGMLAQDLFSERYNIYPIKFEYIGYIGSFLAPVFLMFCVNFLGKTINKTIKRVLCIVPIISIVMIWTNDYHHLFYKQYSINFSEQVTGEWFFIHSIYSYICIAIGVYSVIKATLKKSGFFSVQTLFILLGCLCPLIPNLLATAGVVSMTVYVTPIMFTGTAVCFSIAVIKLKALNVIPVAFKTIINTMSDAFVVLSDDGTIADLNKTFIDKFAPLIELKEKDNLFEKLQSRKSEKLFDLKSFIKESREKGKTITKEYHIEKGEFNRYFEIDIQPIKAKSGNEYIASLLLFRDTTEQKRDIEIMTKNENLVILGELAGGVAHDINTPISAIKSGLLMLKDTVKSDDEKMLVARMDSCADKIVNLVNSMRNQIRNIGSDEKTNINIASVINDTQVIVHNESVKQNVKININVKDDISIMGNATKLSQVITNLVMNAIQAYEGKGGIIDIDLYKSPKNEAIIVIEDYAGGIPERIRDNIFKNILTTKGVSGTGFGLYLAYSVIKGAFGGEMSFETETGKGTKFYITIPMEG